LSNLLYILAVILVIGWLLGFFALKASSLIHVLLVFALIAVIFRLFSGKRV
jgi:Na+/H+ antiporter NhaC